MHLAGDIDGGIQRCAVCGTELFGIDEEKAPAGHHVVELPGDKRDGPLEALDPRDSLPLGFFLCQSPAKRATLDV